MARKSSTSRKITKRAVRSPRTKTTKDCAELDEFNKHRDKLTEHIVEYRVWSRSMESRLHNVVETVQDTVPILQDKIETHIKNSHESWKKMDKKMDDVTTQVGTVRNTIDNVNANGNKGLGLSLKDIYNKLDDLYKVTETDRAKMNLKKSIETIFQNSFFLKTKAGRWISGIIAFIIFKFVSDSMGLNLSWEALKIFFGLG